MQQATDPGMQKGTFQHFCMLTCLLAETIDTTLMSLKLNMKLSHTEQKDWKQEKNLSESNKINSVAPLKILTLIKKSYKYNTEEI